MAEISLEQVMKIEACSDRSGDTDRTEQLKDLLLRGSGEIESLKAKLLEKDEKELVIGLLSKEIERLCGWLQRTSIGKRAETIEKRRKFAENLLKKVRES